MVLLGHTLALKAQDIPLDPAVKIGKLPNGFTYYIRHNEEPKNRVQLYLVSNVGSILEDDDQQGLAHFMEHMNFNGTKNFPKNELIDYLQRQVYALALILTHIPGLMRPYINYPFPQMIRLY